MRKGNTANARECALSVLVACRRNGAWADAALKAQLGKCALSAQDAALCSRIVYGVMQNELLLNWYLSAYCTQKLDHLQPPLSDILRIGAYQILFLDKVPDHAAVSESVELCRTNGRSAASGLVNAVLRKACSYDLSTASFKNEVERLMVLGSAGRDVAEFLHKNYPDEALDILTYKADGGMTSLRANPLKGSADELCAKLLASGAKEAKRGIVPGSVLARFEGSPAENELFRQGYFHVEGQASQLAALCVDAQPGETVIDLCAAPGGKTILLAGHNNTFFNDLQHAETGATVTITTHYGVYTYEVTGTEILDYQDETAYDFTRTDENLILYTCYPFDALGLTPNRFFVYAKYVSGPVLDANS